MSDRDLTEIANDPETNMNIRLSNGILYLVGKNEAEAHGARSRLEFGRDMRSELDRRLRPDFEFGYQISLKDLANMLWNAWGYTSLDHHTQGRITMDGKLKLKRNPKRESYDPYPTFTREEKKLIQQYVELILDPDSQLL